MKTTKTRRAGQGISFGASAPWRYASTQLTEVEERRMAIRTLLQEQMKGAALKLVYQLFKDEMENLCGKPHSRKPNHSYRRGGHESGSVYLSGQRVKVTRPRVHNESGEAPLESYQALKEFDILCEEVARLLLRGVSTRDYGEAVTKIENGLGLKRSSVSRAFIRSSQKDLDKINGRDLSEYTFIGVFFDGLEFAGIHLLVGLGVTDKGQKVILGLREGGSENAEVCKDLIESIINRGFKMLDNILVTLDGSKALKSAVDRVWGEKALIQRCQEHKIRNVQSYLPESLHGEVRRRLKAAYGMKKYEEAKDYLNKTMIWLKQYSENAAGSLEEGLEETLTVHRLELPESLRRTFSSTNPIESLFSTVRSGTNRVKNWKKGRGQISRWAASHLLLRERKLRRIYGYKLLSLLISKLTTKKLEKEKGVA